jgi:hypothetical protein
MSWNTQGLFFRKVAYTRYDVQLKMFQTKYTLFYTHPSDWSDVTSKLRDRRCDSVLLVQGSRIRRWVLLDEYGTIVEL